MLKMLFLLIVLLIALSANANNHKASPSHRSTCQQQLNKCYAIPTDYPIPWIYAESRCNSLGGHLTSIGSSFENTYVYGVFKKF
jgi:hypothetical protein